PGPLHRHVRPCMPVPARRSLSPQTRHPLARLRIKRLTSVHRLDQLSTGGVGERLRPEQLLKRPTIHRPAHPVPGLAPDSPLADLPNAHIKAAHAASLSSEASHALSTDRRIRNSPLGSLWTFGARPV